MKIHNVKIDMSQFEDMLALSSAENFRYDEANRRTTDLLGYSIEVILPALGYERAKLKVNTLPAALKRDALAASGPVQIKPVGNFTANLYIMNGVAGLSLRAESAEIVKGGA